jgi:HSP20 family protein
MRYLTRIDPSGDVRRTMDRFFDDSYWHHANWRMFDGTLSAKVDIHQDDDNLYVTASLPGVRPEDVEVTLSGQTLTITGELKSDEQVEREQYLYRERRTGAFNRALELPVAINGDAASATFENGLLRLTLPKAETEKPRQIKVTVPTA